MKTADLSEKPYYIYITAALVIVLAGIYLAQSVVVLFLISAFVALLGAPFVLWLKEKGVPSVLAVIIFMTVLLLILLSIGAQLVTSVNDFAAELPMMKASVMLQITELSAFLTRHGVKTSDKFFLDLMNTETIMGYSADLLSGLSSAMSDLLLILVTVAFILLEVSSFPYKIRHILGDPKQVFPGATKFVVDMKRYMIIKTGINLLAGVLITLLMYLLDIKFPILWGFLAFLFHYIPNIGAFISAFPAALMALVQWGAGSAALVIAANLLVGFIIGNVLEPRLMGRSLGLSTLVVFVSLVFWGSLLGIVGAILCIPLTIAMKSAFESNKSTVWISVLLGSEKSFRAPPAAKSE